MATKPTLTNPVNPAALRAAFPRATRGMEDGELAVLLEIEEHALRAQFGVLATDEATDEALRRAMLAGWPSFLQQVRQVAQETIGEDSYSVVAARAGVLDFVWPAFVGAILAAVAETAEASYGPAVTELVR